MKNFLDKFKWFVVGGVSVLLASAGVYVAIAAPCFVNAGCTGQANVPLGSTLYGSTTNQSLVVLPVGSADKVQSVINGVPSWTGVLLNNFSVAGVNATSSTSSFNIQGSGVLNPFTVASSSGVVSLIIASNGNVAIGTTSAFTYRLNVSDSLNGGIAVANGNYYATYNTSGVPQNLLGTDNFNNTRLKGFNGSNFYINPDLNIETDINLNNSSNIILFGNTDSYSGNVGIVSSTPNALLTIQGRTTTATPLLYVASSSGSSYLSVAANGSTTISSLGLGVVCSTSAGSLYVGCSSGSSLPSNGIPGQFLGNTATNTPAWLTPLYVTVCASGCNYTATGTNDQVGINNAITAVNAAGGGTVLIKAGTYNISTTKVSVLSNVALVGEGDGTLLNLNIQGTNIQASGTTNTLIQNLRFDGTNMSHASFNGNVGIDIRNASNAKIIDNTFQNMWGFGMFIEGTSATTTGIATATTTDITVMGNSMTCEGQQDCIGGGTNQTGGVIVTPANLSFSNVIISNNHITQTSFSGGVVNSNMDVNCMDMVNVLRQNVQGNVCHGMMVFGNEKYPNSFSEISNNIVSPAVGPITTAGEIVIETGCDNGCSVNAATGTPTGNIINGNVITSGGIAILGDSNSPSTGFVITNNTIQTATSTAQHFRSAENGIELNQTINSLVSDNNIKAFTGSLLTGIKLLNTSSGNTIFNNTIRGFTNGVDLNSQSTSQAELNTFISVTNRIINPGAFLDFNAGNLLIPNNVYFQGYSTSSVAQNLLGINSSGDLHIGSIGSGANSPVNNIYIGFNTPAPIQVGGSCCGGSFPKSFNVDVNGNITFQQQDSTKVTFTSGGNVTVATLTASSLLMSDANKNLQSVTLGTNLTLTGTTLNASGSGSGNSAWTIGPSLIYNATSTDSVLVGTSTPITSNLFVQGSGSKNALTVASSTGASLLQITPLGNVTIATLTSGSVLFAGASGVINQNNANLFWDNTNSRLGVGSSSPLAALSVVGGPNINTLYVDSVNTITGFTLANHASGGRAYGFLAPSGASSIPSTFRLIDFTANTDRIDINSSGNVGINTATPNSTLHVSGTGTTDIFNVSSSSTASQFIVKSNGNVGIGTSTPGYKLVNTGTMQLTGLTTSGSAQTSGLCLNATNEVIADTVIGGCIPVSARRYKNDINPLDNALDEVNSWQPVSFYYKTDFNGSLQSNPNFASKQYGFIADDIQKIDPDLTQVTTATTTFEGQEYPPGTVEQLASPYAFIAKLTSAIQQQQKELQNITVGKVKRSVEENWQDVFIGLLVVYVAYNEIQKRKKA